MGKQSQIHHEEAGQRMVVSFDLAVGPDHAAVSVWKLRDPEKSFASQVMIGSIDDARELYKILGEALKVHDGHADPHGRSSMFRERG